MTNLRYIGAAILVVVAAYLALMGLIRFIRRVQYNRSVRSTGVPKKHWFMKLVATTGVVLLLLLLLVPMVWPDHNNASANGNNDTPAAQSSTADVASDTSICPPAGTPMPVSDTPKFGNEDSNSQQFPTLSGMTLIGNGPALDTTDASHAAADVINRTSYDPMLTSQLTLALHIRGILPDDPSYEATTVTNDQVNMVAAFLINNHDKWSLARSSICARMNHVTLDADPYTAGNMYELATRVQDVDVNGTKMPVSNTNLNRTPESNIARLLWIDSNTVDTSGERPNKQPVAIDTQFAWAAINGDAPADAEQCLPPEKVPPQIMDQNQDKQSSTDSANASKNGNGGGGSSGGGSGGCTDCPGGGGSGGGGGGCDSCTTTSPPGCDSCNTTTTGGPTTTHPPPTTHPPRTTTTTSPPPTTPPPTNPPTTPTTKSNPSTTTTTIPCPPYMC